MLSKVNAALKAFTVAAFTGFVKKFLNALNLRLKIKNGIIHCYEWIRNNNFYACSTLIKNIFSQ